MRLNYTLYNWILARFLVKKTSIWFFHWIYLQCILFWNLIKSLFRPVSKPVYYTTIIQSRRRSSPVSKIISGRIHRKNNMQISLNLMNKCFIKMLIIHRSLLSIILSHLWNQNIILIIFKQPRYLPTGKQSIHPFHKSNT